MKKAVYFGDLETVRSLLAEEKSFVHCEDECCVYGTNGLSIACDKGYSDIVELFLEQSESNEIPFSGLLTTPIRNRDMKIISLLVKDGRVFNDDYWRSNWGNSDDAVLSVLNSNATRCTPEILALFNSVDTFRERIETFHKQNPFYLSCIDGDLDLLRHDLPIAHKDRNNQLSVDLCCALGYLDIVKGLRKNSEVRAKWVMGLWWAVANEQVLVAKYLVSECGINPSIYCVCQGIPYHAAMVCQCMELVHFFLKCPQVDPTKPYSSNSSIPSHRYVFEMVRNCDKVLPLLIEDPRMSRELAKLLSRKNPLVAACEEKKPKTVKVWLDNGLVYAVSGMKAAIMNYSPQVFQQFLEHPEVQEHLDDTVPPLLAACLRSEIETVKDILLHSDAEVNAVYFNVTAVHVAVLFHQEEILSLLLSDERIELDIEGTMSLSHVAFTQMKPNRFVIDHSLIPVAELLWSHPKVDLNALNEDGETTLGVICQQGSLLVLQKFLAYDNLNPNQPNSKGKTALANCKRFNILKVLLKDPRVTVSEKDNDSVIDNYCYGTENLREILRDPRFDPNVVDTSGRSLFEKLARMTQGRMEAMRLLLEHPRHVLSLDTAKKCMKACREPTTEEGVDALVNLGLMMLELTEFSHEELFGDVYIRAFHYNLKQRLAQQGRVKSAMK
mmetsp:Transcript_11009/g.13591  ORF Transcript_11009/g.13591 Transcript_11009/m.13591 type:complete len:668 (-) Transcript_11009:29-2032(-)